MYTGCNDVIEIYGCGKGSTLQCMMTNVDLSQIMFGLNCLNDLLQCFHELTYGIYTSESNTTEVAIL